MKPVIFTQLSVEEFRSILREEVSRIIDPNTINDKEDCGIPLTFLEGCEYVGISPSHGYRLTSKGLIPHSKRGKRIYFDKRELDQWLLANKVKSNQQISEEAANYLSRRARRR